MSEEISGPCPDALLEVTALGEDGKLDFNVALLDVRGKPMEEARPTQGQRQAMRRCQAILGNRTTASDEMVEAADELSRLESDEVRDIPLTLGEVCIGALRGSAKAKEHSAQQHHNRAALALQIGNGYDPEDEEEEGEYGRVKITEKKRKLLNELVKETYENPIITARVAALLMSGDQTQIDDDWDDED